MRSLAWLAIVCVALVTIQPISAADNEEGEQSIFSGLAQVTQGKMSTFGGPNDHGVSPSEGLAIYSSVSQRPEIFLASQPPGTTGLARRLNPDAHYMAMRWDYSKTSVSWLRSHQVTLKNPRNGATVTAWPADWGPNVNTGRVADLSPGVANKLGLKTDDQVVVTVPI